MLSFRAEHLALQGARRRYDSRPERPDISVPGDVLVLLLRAI